ncbi:flagella basal body P-ring formation protein FlgA [Sphaerotilus hippei]|uniref:Flagella basal body P-ring formation protein FlgA n=1 Tax=Sphaerotilus hippei TaxID=744406 RepID=A0A318H429_9BURK|nr:flagellar basal body P-ring formation chaperone FlgA [Sphaerotilus hippei]PXW93700.1 flagella basal body P-ring formation protein FlgA [Sphaerotilus hippei]
MTTCHVALAALLATSSLAPARAQTTPEGVDTETSVQAAVELTRQAMKTPDGTRVEVVPGRLDPRLRLAPCRKVEPYLPPGSAPWGRTRVGLRCTSGTVAWNVYLPVTVHVWAPAWVSRTALAAGATLEAGDLELAETDIAAHPSPTHDRIEALVGRQLNNALPPGTAVREQHLKARRWFAAGETVTVLAGGQGYAVSVTGQAMSAGQEGQPVRVRTDGGRVLLAWPVGDNRVEVRQ